MTFFIGVTLGLAASFVCFSFCITASRNEKQCQLEDASLQASRLNHDLTALAASTDDARLEVCVRHSRALARTLD